MSIDFADPRVVAAETLHRVGESSHDGGTAAVYLVVLDGVRYVLKEYKAEKRDALDTEFLLRLVKWRHELLPEDLAYLDRLTAWPRFVVHEGGRVQGVLLPLAPDKFLEQTLHDSFKPRHLSRLTRSQGAARHIYYEMPEKLARLGELGELMAFLHERDVVIGDLQPQNVLTTAPGHEPAVLLIDCDSVVLHGRSPLPQVDPGHYKLHDDRQFDSASDYWKFATLTVRCLEENNAVWDVRDVRAALAMSPADLELLRRALAEDMSPGDVWRWKALFRVWRAFVSHSGELFYRNEDFLRCPWQGLDDDEHGPPLPEPPAAVPLGTRARKVLGSLSDATKVVVAGAVLVLALIAATAWSMSNTTDPDFVRQDILAAVEDALLESSREPGQRSVPFELREGMSSAMQRLAEDEVAEQDREQPNEFPPGTQDRVEEYLVELAYPRSSALAPYTDFMTCTVPSEITADDVEELCPYLMRGFNGQNPTGEPPRAIGIGAAERRDGDWKIAVTFQYGGSEPLP